jgi:GT2 family glycosyltransferase
VEQVLQDFDDPRIGAIAIPYIDVYKDKNWTLRPPDNEHHWLTVQFRGTAYAVRKEIFNQVGRFREGFRHQGEEADFCLRMLGLGYAVRIGRSDPIHHFESPKRVRAYIFEQSSRNWIINVLLNYPARDVPVGLLIKSSSLLRGGAKRGYLLQALRGIGRGFGYAMGHLGDRQPVPRRRFVDFQRMWRGAKLRLDEVLPLGEGE